MFGASSGATLALEAARQGAPIGRLAVYESPFIVDGTRPANDPRLPEIVSDMVTRGRRADAVKKSTFLRTVGQRLPLLVPDDIRHAGGSLAYFAPEALKCIRPQRTPTAQERGRFTRTVAPMLPFDRVVLIFNPNSTGDAKGKAEELRDDLAERIPDVEVALGADAARGPRDRPRAEGSLQRATPCGVRQRRRRLQRGRQRRDGGGQRLGHLCRGSGGQRQRPPPHHP